MEAILQECLELAQAGYKEVTLLGQNIDAYGRDMVPKCSFADLLTYLNANLPGKMWIRYVTSHPRYFSDHVIDPVANLDKVCEAFTCLFKQAMTKSCGTCDEGTPMIRICVSFARFVNVLRTVPFAVM